MVKAAHIRAYVNPLPGYGETAQRADIVAKFGEPDEWYVESVNVKRAHFIDHLRAGDLAVVARMGCLAKTEKRIDSRMYDFVDARGDIHSKGCYIEDALGFNSRLNWSAAKVEAKRFLLAQRSIKNGSARKITLTNTQVRRVLEVCNMKRYSNDKQRLAALAKENINIGRTYMVEKVPVIARERGIE